MTLSATSRWSVLRFVFSITLARVSHAAVIDSERAVRLGLNVRFLPHDDLLWQALWRLYIDMRLTWDQPNRRLFEGQKASLSL
jgi:hypothetical protein